MVAVVVGKTGVVAGGGDMVEEVCLRWSGGGKWREGLTGGVDREVCL